MFIYASSGNIFIAFLSLQTLNSLQNGSFLCKNCRKLELNPKPFGLEPTIQTKGFLLHLKLQFNFDYRPSVFLRNCLRFSQQSFFVQQDLSQERLASSGINQHHARWSRRNVHLHHCEKVCIILSLKETD